MLSPKAEIKSDQRNVLRSTTNFTQTGSILVYKYISTKCQIMSVLDGGKVGTKAALGQRGFCIQTLVTFRLKSYYLSCFFLLCLLTFVFHRVHILRQTSNLLTHHNKDHRNGLSISSSDNIDPLTILTFALFLY